MDVVFSLIFGVVVAIQIWTCVCMYNGKWSILGLEKRCLI